MFRTIMTRSPRTFTTTATASTPRAFSLTASRHVEQYPNNLSTNSKTKTDKYEADSPHAVQDKIKQGDTYNVQEANAKAGMDAHKQGTGGHATERMDSAGGKAKAKKEFPEAPDPAIGMQDERGGRGA